MFSLITLFLTVIVLGPIAFCLLVFMCYFRKHTFLIKPTFLIPLSVPIVFFSNYAQLKELIQRAPVRCSDFEIYVVWLLEALGRDYNTLAKGMWFVARLYMMPVIFTFFVSFLLSICWKMYSNNYDKWNKFRPQKKEKLPLKIWKSIIFSPFKLISFFGQFVEQHILNHMAVLTDYNPEVEELMIDIKSKDGFLFSGKYSDYYLKDGALSGLTIYNPIKYKIGYNEDGERQYFDSYFFPNDGKMYFPIEDIHNFHIWKVSDGKRFELSIADKRGVTKFAWLLALAWSIPHLNLDIRIYNEKIKKEISEKLKHELDKLYFDFKEIKVTFIDENGNLTSGKRSQKTSKQENLT